MGVPDWSEIGSCKVVRKEFWGLALACVAQWIERQTLNQRVAGLIPSQGTCLGCGLDPQLGVLERQSHIDVSLPLFLSPSSSL